MDYYHILNIEKTATQDEIKKAFRKLAHKHHPDKGGDEEKFKEINKAYQILSDDKKRQEYDRFGSSANSFQHSKGGFNNGFQTSGFGVNYDDFIKNNSARNFNRFSFRKLPWWSWIILLPILIVILIMGLIAIFFWFSIKALSSSRR
jgi:DnaJ-class molecular chaperone